MGLADSKHFLHLVRAMVADPFAGGRGWAESTGIPVSSVFRVIRPFEFHGAIKEITAEPRRVLRLAAALRMDRAMPYANVRLLRSDQQHLRESPNVHLAFQSAANQFGFFEQSELTVRMPLEEAKQYPKTLDGSGTRFNLHVEDLSHFPPPVKIDGALVTDPIITLMDLYSHPRAGAHAEFLDGVLVEAGLLPERKR